MKIDKNLVLGVIYGLAAFTIITMTASYLPALFTISAFGFWTVLQIMAIVAMVVLLVGVAITIFSNTEKKLFVALILKAIAAVYGLLAFIIELIESNGMAGLYLELFALGTVLLIIGVLNYGYKNFVSGLKNKKGEPKQVEQKPEPEEKPKKA